MAESMVKRATAFIGFSKKLGSKAWTQKHAENAKRGERGWRCQQKDIAMSSAMSARLWPSNILKYVEVDLWHQWSEQGDVWWQKTMESNVATSSFCLEQGMKARHMEGSYKIHRCHRLTHRFMVSLRAGACSQHLVHWRMLPSLLHLNSSPQRRATSGVRREPSAFWSFDHPLIIIQLDCKKMWSWEDAFWISHDQSMMIHPIDDLSEDITTIPSWPDWKLWGLWFQVASQRINSILGLSSAAWTRPKGTEDRHVMLEASVEHVAQPCWSFGMCG